MAESLIEVQKELVAAQRDIGNHEKLIDKLSEGITKIQEMNNSVIKMLAVHEERHENHEQAQEDLDKDIKQAEDDIEKEIKELHSRITTTTRETQSSITELGNELNRRLDGILTRLPSDLSKEDTDVKNKLRELEKWKFALTVIFFLFLWVIDHINWGALANLFGAH